MKEKTYFEKLWDFMENTDTDWKERTFELMKWLSEDDIKRYAEIYEFPIFEDEGSDENVEEN